MNKKVDVVADASDDGCASQLSLKAHAHRAKSMHLHPGGITPEAWGVALQNAVQTKNLEEVTRCLEAGAPVDPHILFDRGRNHSTRKFAGTPLHMAIIDGQTEIVKALVDWNADLEQDCKMIVGAARVTFHAKAVNVAIGWGNMQVVKQIVQQKADLTKACKFSNSKMDEFWNAGPTCIWQAAHHGHTEMLSYFLASPAARSQIETHVNCQDDMNLMHTPLHQACRMGRTDCVKMLIEAKANFRSVNQDTDYRQYITPLTDAILNSKPQVVRLLVAESADLWMDETIEALFGYKTRNEVLIAAAALGLEDAAQKPNTTAFELMEIGHFVSFLSTPGSAPVTIMRAVFQKRTLCYWAVETKGISKKADTNIRKTVMTACLGRRADAGLRCAVGQDSSAFEKLMQPDLDRDNMLMDPRQWDFIEEIAPEPKPQPLVWRLLGQPDETQVPVEVLQCIIRGVHDQVEVLFAVANCLTPELFVEWGAKAMILHGWKRTQHYWIINLLLNFLFLGCLLAATLDLEPDYPWVLSEPERLGVTVVAGFLIAENAFVELTQIIGFTVLNAQGIKGTSYFGIGNLLDLLRLALCVGTVAILALRWVPKNALSDTDRLILSATALWRWWTVLYSLRGFRYFGPKLLPILEAMKEVWLFFLITMPPFLGFTHAYHALGIRTAGKSLMDMFRLGFLGDFDIEELEDIDGSYHADQWNSTVWNWEDPEPTDMKYPVWFVLILMGGIMTIAMMNIFIAVLSENFDRNYTKREQLFLQARANMLKDYFAMQAVLERIWNSVRRKRRVNPSSTLTNDKEQFDYLWLCKLDQSADDAGVALQEVALTQMEIVEEIADEKQEDMKDDAVVRQHMEQMNERMAKLEELIQGAVTRSAEWQTEVPPNTRRVRYQEALPAPEEAPPPPPPGPPPDEAETGVDLS